MAWFITRVQLIDAEEADYDKLHEAMESKGFVRQTTFTDAQDNTRLCVLPHAEYFYEGEKNGSGVRSLAKSAVNTVGFEAQIIVIQTSLIWSYNLETA